MVDPLNMLLKAEGCTPFEAADKAVGLQFLAVGRRRMNPYLDTCRPLPSCRSYGKQTVEALKEAVAEYKYFCGQVAISPAEKMTMRHVCGWCGWQMEGHAMPEGASASLVPPKNP